MIITFTELAKKQILTAIEDEQTPGLALRIAVTNHRSKRVDFDLLVKAVSDIGRAVVNHWKP